MGQFTLKSSSSWRLSFSLPSWPSLPQFLLKTPLRLLLPRQNSPQPLLLLKLVNTLLLPLFKALPLTWLIYPRLLKLRLLTLLALSHSPLPLFSPEFNLLMLSNLLSPPLLSPLSPLLLTPMPTTMVPTVPTLPTPMLLMLVPTLAIPMLVPTDTPPMPSVDTPMPSPWQLPKPNKVEKA